MKTCDYCILLFSHVQFCLHILLSGLERRPVEGSAEERENNAFGGHGSGLAVQWVTP